MNEIRHISAAYNSSKVALGEFKRRVQIFDVKARSVVSDFDTILDFGGKRMALNSDGRVCICGSWARHGIVACDADTGNTIWQRKDLKKAQHLHFLYHDANKLFAQFDKGVSRILDVNTGMDIKKLNGIELFWDSQYGPVETHQKSTGINLIDGPKQKVIKRIPRHRFATLALTFAVDSFAISESAGPLTCYSCIDGTSLWQIPLGPDGHFLSLSFNSLIDRYLGVSWPFTQGGQKKLKIIHPHTGIIERELEIECPATTEFALNGNMLVSSDRMLIDIQTLKISRWG